VDNEIIRVNEIVSFFQESGDLLQKPKLFFIQTCRVQNGIDEDGAPGESSEKKDFVEKDNGDYGLLPPQSSDTLVAQSTIKGEPSYRNTQTGSWYIQTLIKQLKDHAKSKHLMDIMTKVNNDMSGRDFGGYRQMPIQASTLTKSVYFNTANQ
jgi:hypothetical protein